MEVVSTASPRRRTRGERRRNAFARCGLQAHREPTPSRLSRPRLASLRPQHGVQKGADGGKAVSSVLHGVHHITHGAGSAEQPQHQTAVAAACCVTSGGSPVVHTGRMSIRRADGSDNFVSYNVGALGARGVWLQWGASPVTPF